MHWHEDIQFIYVLGEKPRMKMYTSIPSPAQTGVYNVIFSQRPQKFFSLDIKPLDGVEEIGFFQ